MYDRICVPTDGSDGTRQAIDHAITIAKRFDATIHALSVLVEGPYGSLQSDRIRAAAREGAERAIERVEREAEREGVDVVSAIRTGVPDEEIVDYVVDEDIDMIVMGTHGRSGVDRFLVGSVTERVVRQASVPVVTVRATDEPRVGDAETAESIAIEALEARGHENATVQDAPHRTSGSWIVAVDSGEGTVHVHVDAVTGDARIATID